MDLNAKNVDETFKYGLFKEGELDNGMPKGDFIKVAGIVQNFGFHPRILERKDDIQSMINQLDSTFREGWSFLNLPFDKDQNQWGEQPNAEQLYAIARAVDLAEFCIPREFWVSLPGGVPYIQFKLNEQVGG